MKTTFKICLKATLIILCFLNTNRGTAQLNANKISDKIIKYPFNQVLKQEEQKRNPVRFGFGLETYVSGNAHGAFYSARLNMSKGKSVFSLGPCLQKRYLEFTGIKLGYSYLLSGINNRYDKHELEEMKDEPQDILELRVLCYIQYLNKTRLSYAATRVETVTSNVSSLNYNEVRLSTIEVAFCAEIDINIKWLKIRGYMGATAFYHTNYLNGMYRPKCSPALIFGTGFIVPSI